MSELCVSSEFLGDSAVLALTGELDLAGSAAFESELDDVLRRVEPKTLVVDLSGLAFMDSTGLRALVVADRRLRAEGRRFVLIRGAEPVQRVFAITRMDRRLEFADRVQDATRPTDGTAP